MLAWVLGGVIVLAVIAALALQFAISRNGPAVLSAVDRIMGGNNGAELKARIATGDHQQQKLIVWAQEARTSADAPAPVLVFAHGGSWRTGDPADYGFLGRAFAAQGFVVVLVGYRLGEDGKYPAMLEDTARAVAWTHKEIAAYGGDPERIVLAGHSAGAYNVVMTALEERWLAQQGVAAGDLAGVIGLSGPYDFVPFDSDSTIASFGHVADPAVTQPLSHIRADAPPMFMIHGMKDTLVRPRNSLVLVEALEEAGASASTRLYPEMEHNDPLISIAEPWRSRRDVVETIVTFVRRVTARDKTSVPVQPQTR